MDKFKEKSITLETVSRIASYLEELYNFHLDESQRYLSNISNTNEYDCIQHSEEEQIIADTYSQILKLLDNLI